MPTASWVHLFSNVMGKSGLRLIEEMITAEVLTEERIQKLKGSRKIARKLKSKAGRAGGGLPRQLVGRSEAADQLLPQTYCTSADLKRVIDDLPASGEHDATKVLQTMPGIDETTAKTIVGIIGTGVTRFPTPDHLCAWAGAAQQRKRGQA